MTFAFLLNAFPSITFAANGLKDFADAPAKFLPDSLDPCASASNATDMPGWTNWLVPPFPPLKNFAASVANGDASTVTGVYVCDGLALPVIQQPANDAVFVSPRDDILTQFRLAAQYGTLGLLAHNDHAGAKFFNLKIGQAVAVVYGDGHIRRYTITALRHFQPIIPTDPYSNFNDLDNGGVLSSSAVFQQIYGNGGDQVVFQTCIAKDGEPSWGRLFVIATP